MSGKSLRLRLLATGVVAVLLALAVAGAAMVVLFERHLERRAVAEAETHLKTLIAGASLDADGKLVLASYPADPAFNEAYGGNYWQVQQDAATVARSRSLWDTELALPRDELARGVLHIHDLDGPRGSRLLAIERPLILTGPAGPQNFRIIVAQDRRDITAARNDFAYDLGIGLLLLSAALFLASVAQVRIGLRPLSAVQRQLQAVREGGQPRLPDEFPAEVTPLANEINAMLDERDAAVARARGRAADLAHGLKTPLTALAANVRALRQSGDAAMANEIDSLGALMRRHVERELARARIAARPYRSGATPVRPVAELIAAAVARTPGGEGISFDFDIEADAVLPIERSDLEEILGNLIENAARHARSVVRIRASSHPPHLQIADDGAGLPDGDHARFLQRGERLDQVGGSAGLGLSIVVEIVEAYEARLTLTRADLGGLAAAIAFPDPSPAKRFP